MRLVFANSDNHVLAEYERGDGSRIPVKGDYVCFRNIQRIAQDQSASIEGIVKKVMLDYVQNIAIVTVRDG